jgi:hypothetical protein
MRLQLPLLGLALMATSSCYTREMGQPLPCCSLNPPMQPRNKRDLYAVTGLVQTYLPFEGPVAGATVTAVRDDSQYGPVTTGPDGRFRLEVLGEELEKRPITITIVATGFETRAIQFQRRVIEDAHSEGRRDLTIVLERVATP